jgi:hypothetical protein
MTKLATAYAPQAAAALPPQEILAAIAAAVHATLGGRRHRVAQVVDMSDALEWAREGRRAIFGSHRVR